MKRTGRGIGHDGDGSQRGEYPKSPARRRRTGWHELLEVDGSKAEPGSGSLVHRWKSRPFAPEYPVVVVDAGYWKLGKVVACVLAASISPIGINAQDDRQVRRLGSGDSRVIDIFPKNLHPALRCGQ